MKFQGVNKIVLDSIYDELFKPGFRDKYGFYNPGTSLDGWRLHKAKEKTSPELYSIINFSPFNFSTEELDAFIEVLEISLKMVPVADYYGIYKGDHGYALMGVKDGRPYFMDLGWSYDECKIDKYLESAQSWG